MMSKIAKHFSFMMSLFAANIVTIVTLKTDHKNYVNYNKNTRNH